MDEARKQTDEKLLQMERKVNKIYKDAYSDISENWVKYMDSHAPKLQKAYDALQEAIKSGDKAAIDEAKDKYQRTAMNITVNNKRFQGMADETAAKISHTNEVALAYVNDQVPGIYTVNYNAFKDEKIKGYSFALVNEQAVKNLAKADKLLLPTKKVDIPKDMRWNEKLINSQMLQGILQGESIPKLAERLSNVTDMNCASAIRNARTMTTAAENKGRNDSYHKAADDGVIMKRVWVATNDERTRAWHADLDGVEVDLDEPWENEYGEISYPGDPSADPANVYNCRCAMRVDVKGFRWNKELEDAVESEINPENVVTVRHYTSEKNADNIMENGFDLSKSGTGAGNTWGDGAYFLEEGSNEELFYKYRLNTEAYVESQIDTSGMLKVETLSPDGEAYGSINKMYSDAAKSLPEEYLKEFRSYSRSMSKEDAFIKVANEHYTGLVIEQDLKGGAIDPLVGGNQIVVFDKDAILNIQGKDLEDVSSKESTTKEQWFSDLKVDNNFDPEDYADSDTKNSSYTYELANEADEYSGGDDLILSYDNGDGKAFIVFSEESNTMIGLGSTGGGAGTEAFLELLEHQSEIGEGLHWMTENKKATEYYRNYLGLKFGCYARDDKMTLFTYNLSPDGVNRAIELVKKKLKKR